MDLSIKIFMFLWMKLFLFRVVVVLVFDKIVYFYFCVGENVEVVLRILVRMWEFGLCGVMIYGFEDVIDSDFCD